MDIKKLLREAKQINAKRVIIESDDELLIIEKPQVVTLNLMGQEIYQIIGKARKEKKKEEVKIEEEDVKIIMEKLNVSREKAIEALKEAKGDLALAIEILSRKD